MPGDEAKGVILGKIIKVIETLTCQWNRPVNNRDIIEHILNFWIERIHSPEGVNPNFTTYQKLHDDANEILFAGTNSAVQKLTEIAENHAKLIPHTQYILLI